MRELGSELASSRFDLPRHQRHLPRHSPSAQDPKMSTARRPFLPTRAVASLIPAGLQGQVPAEFDTQVAGADVEQVHLRCPEKVQRCVPTFQGGASRHEPPYIRGA